MGSYTYLYGCTSKEDAFRRARALFGTEEQFNAAGPVQGRELGAKYRAPLFWLAAFAPGDEFQVVEPADEYGPETPYLCLWSPTALALERLERRKAAVLNLLGGEFEGPYDQWRAFLADQFPDVVMMQPQDILNMGDIEEGNAFIKDCIRQLESSETSGKIASLRPFHQLSAIGSSLIELSGASFDDVLDWPSREFWSQGANLEGLPAEPSNSHRKPWWKFWG